MIISIYKKRIKIRFFIYINNLKNMSRRCEMCERKSLTGNNRSHAMNATKRKQHLNLQSRTVGDQKIKICTSCIKTLAKESK
jgi:ribosomal protein L28